MASTQIVHDGAYRPFIDDPSFRAEFEGQRFVVLRAHGAIGQAFGEATDALRRRFPEMPLLYIAHPHVTLAGFARGTALEAIRDVTAAWASQVAPLTLDVERSASFPDPSRVVMLGVRKTPALVHALSTLRRMCEERGLSISHDVSVDDWHFHMSVAYGTRLTAPQWEDVAQYATMMPAAASGCTVADAEIVAFDEGREYLGGLSRLGDAGHDSA